MKLSKLSTYNVNDQIPELDKFMLFHSYNYE